MISIQPKWCELIASGKKTIEVRKTRPKIETPFKCYIYATKAVETNTYYYMANIDLGRTPYNGKVIGYFVCDFIADGKAGVQEWRYICEHSCLSCKEIYDYCGEDEDGETKYCYGWHISDLVIYDKPKELGEFICKCNKKYCTGCEDFCDEGETIFRMCGGLKAVTRPTQSWQYVEEKEN